jgi:phosphoribosylformylglycinamidine synthase
MTGHFGAGVDVAVVQFPGSNCEHDAAEALSGLGARVELVWHTRRSLAGFAAVVVPGGFAHGDYLRPGAIARFSPVMEAVSAAAESGVPVLGICNGFQVLTEAHLLPGALQRNAGGRFLCVDTECEVVSTSSVLTAGAVPGRRLRLPINHFEGNYTCGRETQLELESRGQIPLRYVANPNGSMGSIAAVANETGNVVGLMPHPERACSPLTGSTDGAVLLTSFLQAAANRAGVSGAVRAAAFTGS